MTEFPPRRHLLSLLGSCAKPGLLRKPLVDKRAHEKEVRVGLLLRQVRPREWRIDRRAVLQMHEWTWAPLAPL